MKAPPTPPVVCPQCADYERQRHAIDVEQIATVGIFELLILKVQRLNAERHGSDQADGRQAGKLV